MNKQEFFRRRRRHRLAAQRPMPSQQPPPALLFYAEVASQAQATDFSWKTNSCEHRSSDDDDPTARMRTHRIVPSAQAGTKKRAKRHVRRSVHGRKKSPGDAQRGRGTVKCLKRLLSWRSVVSGPECKRKALCYRVRNLNNMTSLVRPSASTEKTNERV